MKASATAHRWAAALSFLAVGPLCMPAQGGLAAVWMRLRGHRLRFQDRDRGTKSHRRRGRDGRADAVLARSDHITLYQGKSQAEIDEVKKQIEDRYRGQPVPERLSTLLKRLP